MLFEATYSLISLLLDKSKHYENILNGCHYILTSCLLLQLQKYTFDATIQLTMFGQRKYVPFKDISIPSFWESLFFWFPYSPSNIGF